jgi:hypothetical protein
MAVAQIMADMNYTEIVKQCYSPLFKGAGTAGPGPVPAPAATIPVAPQALPTQPAPAYTPPAQPNLRISGMFDGVDNPVSPVQKKQKPKRAMKNVEVIFNAIVWVTLAAVVTMFFIVAIYSQMNPIVTIRQGDIPLPLVAGLAIGSVISLVKGITIIRGIGNAG